MREPSPDDRSPDRRDRDDQIAAEPRLAIPDLKPGATPAPVETYLTAIHPPRPVTGVVENGLVRPLDPDARLAEGSRVIIVAVGG